MPVMLQRFGLCKIARKLRKYELLDKLLATEQEDALFSASQIGPIRESLGESFITMFIQDFPCILHAFTAFTLRFQSFLLRRFQGRWTLQQASSLSVADVLTDWYLSCIIRHLNRQVLQHVRSIPLPNLCGRQLCFGRNQHYPVTGNKQYITAVECGQTCPTSSLS